MADNLLAHVPRSIVLSERLVALDRERAVFHFEDERFRRSGSPPPSSGDNLICLAPGMAANSTTNQLSL